jgi:hypothetical protein
MNAPFCCSTEAVGARDCRPGTTWFSTYQIGDFAEWLALKWRVEKSHQDIETPRGTMRTNLVQEHPSVMRSSVQAHVRSGSLAEVIAISLAWPLGLTWFVRGLMTEQPLHAVQGLAVFFLVFFYVLVRLYQLRRRD